MNIGERFANAWNIFKTSFAFIGRDKSLLIVPVVMLLSVVVGIVIILGSLIAFQNKEALEFVTTPFGGIIILFFFYCWITFLGAAQSWMVYEVAQGKDTTFFSGVKRAVANILDIIFFSVAMVVIRMITAALRGRGRSRSPTGIPRPGIGDLAGSIIDKVAGVAGKLILPAMIVTDKSFGEAVRDINSALKALPEVVIFEVGIGPLTTVALMIGIGIAWVLTKIGAIYVAIGLGLVWIVLIIMFSILINQVYYTLLYLKLVERKKIQL